MPLPVLNTEKYRDLIPRLSDHEFAALEANILAARGIFDPIIHDEEMNLLDGQHRYEIALKHKITNARAEVIKGLTEDEKRHFVLFKNCARRHLTTKQKEDLIVRELKHDPRISDRRLGELLGVDGKTVGKYRKANEASGTIPKVEQVKSERDGKAYTYTRTNGRLASSRVMARDLKKNKKAKPCVAWDKKEIGRLTAIEIRDEHNKPIAHVPPGQIHTCDFRELEKVAGIKPNSARLIFTDPMYEKKYLWQWELLSELAERWLVKGGALVTYCGADFLPEVTAGLGKHLQYHTLCIGLWAKEAAKGKRVSGVPSATNIHKRVEQNYTPILIYSKHSCRFLTILRGVVRPPLTGNPTSYYPFQKPVEDAMHFLKSLTRPGELVIDPMMGSGFVGIACDEMGRQFIGGDINPDCKNVYANRHKDWLDHKAKSEASEPDDDAA